MVDADRDDTRRAVRVTPQVHVETFATHWTVTWKAGSLARFLEAVRDVDAEAATAVVNDTAVAGRQRRRVPAIDPTGETVRYVRVEPDGPWTLAWERRTRPVVSLSGTPSSDLCRRVHLRTTDCDGWDPSAIEDLRRLIGEDQPGA